MRTLLKNTGLLAASFVLAAAVMFVVSALVSPPSGGTVTTAFANGPELFDSYCRSCHVASGGSGGAIGPDLSRIGADAASRKPGTSAVAYLAESIVAPAAFMAPGAQAEMPDIFGDVLHPAQIKSLVWFMANQGANGDLQAVRALRIGEMIRSQDDGAEEDEPEFVRDRAQLARGREVFFETASCDRCHGVLPAEDGVRRLGPGLMGVGTKSTRELREAVVSPSAVLHPRFLQVDVRMANAQTQTGILLESDAETVTIVRELPTGVGEILTIPVADLDGDAATAVVPTGTSSMPDNYGEILTTGQLDDLVAYLKTLY